MYKKKSQTKILPVLLISFLLSFSLIFFFVFAAEGDFIESWATDSLNGFPSGITNNNTFMWIGDLTDDEVYKYYMNGTYTGDSFDTAGSGNNAIIGITTNNTFIWVGDDTDEGVYKYYMNGTYTGDFWSLTGANAVPRGITNNNTFIWVGDPINDEVYKYYMNGTYTSDSFDTAGSGSTSVSGVTTNNTFIWISDFSQDEVYKFYMNGTYTGDSFDIAGSGNTEPRDMTNDNIFFWIVDGGGARVYKYELADNPPKWQDNSTNSTLAGTPIQHIVNWTDDIALDGFIFSFDNGTGTFVNDTFASMTGTVNYSNVTKFVNQTVGSTIRWIVYANDSSNNFNNTDTFSYTTTSANTCTYSSGDWNVDCSDNCVITTNTGLPDNSLNLEGTGTFTILADITVNRVVKDINCQLINKAGDGNSLIIKLG